jgi:hypothetical protein
MFILQYLYRGEDDEGGLQFKSEKIDTGRAMLKRKKELRGSEKVENLVSYKSNRVKKRIPLT